MGALYLKDLADKTRRGLRGRIEAGKSGGGNSYGYEVVTKISAAGEPERGERRINEREAAIVRHIFKAYAAGRSPKAIAQALNKRRRSRPRPARRWGPSTINGNWRRGTGILNNELYIGRLVWNRLSLHQEPGHRKAHLAAEPDSDVDHQGRAGAADRRPGALGAGQGAAEGPAQAARDFHEQQRPRMLLSYLLTMRLLRRRLQQGFADALWLLDRPQQRHLREPPDRPAGRSRGARHRRAARAPDGPGAARGVLRGVHAHLNGCAARRMPRDRGRESANSAGWQGTARTSSRRSRTACRRPR